MNPGTILLVAVAGGIGAALRLLLDGLITGRRQSPVPLGTLTINVTGSFLLGLLTGAATHLTPTLVATMGTGLLGGYTTFSTASFETVRLIRAGRTTVAALNGLGMLVIAVAASAAGLAVGTLF